MAKKNNNKKDLDALSNLENDAKGIDKNEPVLVKEKVEAPNVIDGYKTLNRCDLPQGGVLYPESWQFAYRCPSSKEVANFSTLNDNDQPAIIAAIEDLIKKCVVIFDSERERQVSAEEVNDAHRTFFMLKLRDFYLPNSKIEFTSVCSLCKEPTIPTIFAENLIFRDVNPKLISAFDGRSFSLIFPNIEDPIEFLIPTIKISSRIFKYVVKVYREAQNDREKKSDKIVYDKKFLLIAPYLYVRGNETMKEIIKKFKEIQEDDTLFKAYMEIATKIKLDNEDFVNYTCEHCESEEVAEIRFPGGWKKMFIDKNDTTGYFD